MSNKKQYVLKGKIKDKEVYFLGFVKRILWGSEWNVRKYSDTIVGATIYDNLTSAKEDLKLLDNFRICLICPICHKDYEGYPVLSRIDNKTEICPQCGAKEAMESFFNNKKK